MTPRDQRSRTQDRTSSGRTGERAGQAQEKAGQVAGQAQEKAGQVMNQTQETAGQVTGQAKGMAANQLESQKIRVASGLSELANVVRQVSQTLREQDKANYAGYADNAADQIERISGYVRHQDVNDMVSGVERFARRQPAMFLGGAFALGMLGARFLKASQPEGDGEISGRYGDQYGSMRANRSQAYDQYRTPRYADTPRRAAGYADTPPGPTGQGNTDTTPEYPTGAEG